MEEPINLKNDLYSLKLKAFHALEEFIDLPIHDNKGNLIRETLYAKLSAMKMILSVQTSQQQFEPYYKNECNLPEEEKIRLQALLLG